MLHYLVYTIFTKTVMVSGVAVRNLCTSLYSKFVVYWFSLAYICLAPFNCVYIFLQPLDSLHYLPALLPSTTIHMSRVSDKASKHYHRNKPLL